jgi:hypothetical protein
MLSRPAEDTGGEVEVLLLWLQCWGTGCLWCAAGRLHRQTSTVDAWLLAAVCLTEDAWTGRVLHV